MRVLRRTCLIWILTAGGLVGCDRTPTDPAAGPGFDASQSSVFAPSHTSLSHLFRRSIERLEQENGAAGTQKLLARWRRLNEEARAALAEGDRQTAQSQIEAVRGEELRFTAQVLGRQGVHEVVKEVGLGLVHVRLDWGIAEASGKDISHAGVLANQVSQLLTKANLALQDADDHEALDQATRASDLLDGVTHFLIALRRIPGLETLHSEAVARVRYQQDRALLLGAWDRLNAEARDALRRGQRERARLTLEAARKEQIRVVLRVKGTGVVATLLDQVDTGVAATRLQIARLTDRQPSQRATRMLAEAANLAARARNAFDRGDAATALDLGSHAAGVVNALQHLLPR